ncbi:VCBS repeat-containing protein [Pricia antarctica]|nr:VCBS repeat-containing protein [Pricia antarctica]
MNRLPTLFVLIFALVLLSSCIGEKSRDSDTQNYEIRFRKISSDSSNITFNNRIVENETFNMVDFFYVYNGGGVAIGDINNDSLPDLYFTGNMVDDRLYLNKGGLKFEDITASAGIDIPGWSTGVTMVDINHDGLLDIYVCRSGNYEPGQRKNLLFINQGNETFEEKAETFGLADTSYSTQAAFFDYDKDGDLDLYLLNHTNAIRDPNNVLPLIKDGSGPANDRLYRNEETESYKITFTDVSLLAGIRYDGMGLGVGIADVNEDGWEDIFVTNDFIANDYLYINNQQGAFDQMSQTHLDHVSHFSMGNDMADFNNDGLIDMVTADMLPRDNFHEKKMSGPLNYDLFQYTLQQGYMPQYMRNTLQLNNGQVGNYPTSFSEIGQLAGIQATDWSWSPLFADFDNDGLKDLFMSNGYLRDITDLDFINYTGSLSGNVTQDSLDAALKRKARQMPSIALSNFMFKNNGDLSFQDVSEKWGLNEPSLSNGTAYADLDNDGDLDIVANTINSVAFIYENRSEKLPDHNFINIGLVGDSLNLNALGAEVRLFTSDSIQMLQQSVTRGYQSSVDYKLHFGLGDIRTIDSLSVEWPDGKYSILCDLKANQLLVINKTKTATDSLKRPSVAPASLLFQEVTDNYEINYKHDEEDYLDFNRQFLLPHKHSRQGPGIAVSDINGDGREDFFVGGGYNRSGQLFYSKPDKRFEQKPLVKNEKEKYEEDTGILFFDYDSDGDQDLYIVSGSNEFYEGSEYFQDRLYNNDGKGNFSLDEKSLPTMLSSGSCVRAADFDRDGDLDLFVGGRLVPLKYPLPPDSYLLQNENGRFTDVTSQLAPALRKIGMVTDALWTDFDNDGDTDLIAIGEFMDIQFFENDNGKLENVSGKTGLSYTSGWWNSINGGDFDKDGDIDYILGNLGLNTKYKASPKEPITAYGLDYDRNGVLDPILTSYVNGVEHPIHSRDDFIKQIPAMKKKFPDYASYAQAKLDDLLSPKEKSSAYQVKAFNFATSYLRNDGNGQFELINLPREAQLAPVYGILVQDFDSDGFLDIVLTGNDFGTEVGSGRYDAFKGCFLRGNGKGDFEPFSNSHTGLFVDGDNRGAVSLQIDGQFIALFGRNSGRLRLYSTVNPEKECTLFDVPTATLKVKIVNFNGTERWQECYYGSSYLSQSSRILKLYDGEKQIELYDFVGKKTIIDLPN